MKPIVSSSLLFVAVVIAAVQCDDAQKASSPGSSFSLEEIMLLADAAEKAQKKGGGGGDNNDENANSSTFQHRLKQLIQTARVAAGSGQSTGNDVLDQTIRQIRARVNAGGGAPSVSDTSIFDAALKAFGTNGAQSAPALIVDTVVKQLSPDAAPTTPPPQQDSFLGGILKQLANGNQGGGGSDPKTVLFDAVVKQFVPTTTTTTTTTTTPRPSPLQLLDGLVKAYQGRNAPAAQNGDSKQPAQPNILNGLQDLFQQLQNKPQPASPPQQQPAQPGTQTDAKDPQGGGGSQLLEGFLNQLKQLQSRGQSGSASAGDTGGSQTPDLGDALKQIQNALRNRFGAAAGQPTGSTASPGDISLEGFEGLVPANGQAPPTAAPAPVPARASQSQPTNTNDALGKLFGGFVDQLRTNAGSSGNSGNQDPSNLLKGLSDIFNRNRQTPSQ